MPPAPQKNFLVEEIRIEGVPEQRVWAIEAIVEPLTSDLLWRVKTGGLLVCGNFELSLRSADWFAGAIAERVWEALHCYARVSVRAREVVDEGQRPDASTHVRDETDYRVYEATRAFLRRAGSSPMTPTHVAVIAGGGQVAAAWPAYSYDDALRLLRVWYAGRRAADFVNNRETFESEESAGPDPLTADVETISNWYSDINPEYYVEIIELQAEGPFDRELREHRGDEEAEAVVRRAMERVMRSGSPGG